LDIPQRDASVEGCSDERVAERVRPDRVADPGPGSGPADDPGGAMPVQPPPVRSQEDRSLGALADALDRFAEFSGKWEKRYPAIIRLWENAWAEFVPFLAFDREIRTVICTTNAIESINARLRRAVNARGHFPTEQAALKCLYLAIMSLDPTGRGRKRWTNRWKAALNAFDITFDGRLSAGRK
jgi:hypothetical protein